MRRVMNDENYCVWTLIYVNTFNQYHNIKLHDTCSNIKLVESIERISGQKEDNKSTGLKKEYQNTLNITKFHQM